MATPATATAAALPPSLVLCFPPSCAPITSLSLPARPVPVLNASTARRFPCRVALSTDLSSSSEIEVEEQQAAAKIGKRVRVTAPLRVHHVQKAPDLDLDGLEGVIKQYVGVWKGKRISANLPFKVEFQIAVQGQPRPVKFVSHLKEDEFEYLE
ncbi:ferredoxin-thioredoxin reductase, variable chain-like [Curcuma longa]|uniref:ferredoxin-thioredoxin reductase, variable chain-like n=1 Tax=Curcuma longa TaxID=136217 RepID=UPI003D9FAD15